jgi:hypothetical protein
MNAAECGEMNAVENRELSIGELEAVSGGRDGLAGYKFCWYGPAGTGLYPTYVTCGNGLSLGENIVSGGIAGALDGM